MDRIFCWKDAAGLELPAAYAGVAVWLLEGEFLHIGVLYRTGQNPPWVLHLMGHLGGAKGSHLHQTSPDPDAICVLCPLDEVEIPAIAATLRQIHRANKNPGLPYGLSVPTGEWFDEEGNYVGAMPGRGLCCQTFVLAAYQAAERPLLDCDSPGQRIDDAERQHALLDRFHTTKPHIKQHFDAVRAAVPSALFRPLEVAGAALAESIPCPFEVAERNGEEVRRRLYPGNALE